VPAIKQPSSSCPHRQRWVAERLPRAAVAAAAVLCGTGVWQCLLLTLPLPPDVVWDDPSIAANCVKVKQGDNGHVVRALSAPHCPALHLCPPLPQAQRSRAASLKEARAAALADKRAALKAAFLAQQVAKAKAAAGGGAAAAGGTGGGGAAGQPGRG
jgi:hypothetical protein